MAEEVVGVFYMCPRCLEPADEATPCPKCGGERVRCRPGQLDDPCRKPLMAATGEIAGHAPVWWLRATGMVDDESTVQKGQDHH